jgi:NADPH2:quinone reductase
VTRTRALGLKELLDAGKVEYSGLSEAGSQPFARRLDLVRAVWYERQGPAAEVLQVGELPDPQPGPGEVRVRLTHSGVNPGDTKKRRGWLGSAMAFPRVIPHSDGAGAVESVGEGVDPNRVRQRVWVFGAQSYRPFGTAAQLMVVPSGQAVDLPQGVGDELGACLGIPGITAHRAVFADGPVTGLTVLVHGVLGGVGALAAQLARWGGATVIGTVRRSDDLRQAAASAIAHAVALDQPDAASAIRAHAPDGVDRIIEVGFSDNVDLDAAVARNQTVIAAYASSRDRPDFPFWPMLFDNITIRLLGSDDFPIEAKQRAAADLTTAASDGALSIAIGPALPLEHAAEAHDRVDAGVRARVLLAIPD